MYVYVCIYISGSGAELRRLRQRGDGRKRGAVDIMSGVLGDAGGYRGVSISVEGCGPPAVL